MTRPESVEYHGGVDTQLHRSPGQRAGLQTHLAVPLNAPTQPSGPDPVEVTRQAPTRFVRPLRDAGVDGRVPDLPQPPRPRVIGHRQQPIAAPELLAKVAGRAGRR
jgi:hypothetical protein